MNWRASSPPRPVISVATQKTQPIGKGRRVEAATPKPWKCSTTPPLLRMRSCSRFFEEQERLARDSKEALEQSVRFSDSIATATTQSTAFYTAEEYHQDYYLKNPLRYKFYRYQCGRGKRLEQLWGDTN